MFKSIARFSVRFRWLIIIFWIAMVPITNSAFPNITSVTKNNTEDFLPKNSPTAVGSKLEQAFQKKDTATTAAIIISRNGRLSASDIVAASQVVGNVKKVNDVVEVRDIGSSADGQAHEYLVGISGAAFGNGATAIVGDIRDAMHKTSLPSGLNANLTGDLAAQVDQENANNQGKDNTEKYSIILILLLLLIVFRSILAPIITLLPAALALVIAQPVIAESTKAGVQVGFITQILLIVLLLGAGADYGLFLVFRVREEMRKGMNSKEAVVEALSHVGESISYSAATVIAALLSLGLATFGLYKGLGPALAIGLFIMLLLSLTFLPAVLSLLGRAVFWPTKVHKQDLRIGIWGRLADRAIKKPYLILAMAVVIFGGLMVFGLSSYKSGGFGSSSAPAGSDSAKGQQALDKHYPAASDNPQLIIFHFPGSVWNNPSALAKAQNTLQASGLFKALSGPLNANGFSLTPEQLQNLHQHGGPAAQAVSQFISPDGRTAQFYAVLKAGQTGSAAAVSAVPTVRDQLGAIQNQIGADQSSIFSEDSVGYDINQTATHDLKKIIPVVLLIIAVLLALLLRSLVAPWYLIATVGLSYLASLGFANIVFVKILGQDGLNFVLPFLMFIFGMALGEDYNILVMSRIREEAHHSQTLFSAITKAIGITGTTVTSAGLILAGTFTILGIVGGNGQVEQIGFGVAFAIMLDTFFVRTLLVPSIVAMLGKWNWWPSKLSNR